MYLADGQDAEKQSDIWSFGNAEGGLSQNFLALTCTELIALFLQIIAGHCFVLGHYLFVIVSGLKFAWNYCLQAKLAKLRRELLDPTSGSGAGGGGKGEGEKHKLCSTFHTAVM